MKDNVVLEVSHLKKYFDLGHGRTLHAVDDVCLLYTSPSPRD